MNKSFYTIKVLDVNGNWYNNAYIENDYDALMVARFYKNTLGYFVQVWKDDEDITAMCYRNIVNVEASERALFCANKRLRSNCLL